MSPELTEEIRWLQRMLQLALSEFTTPEQAINYIANQPQIIFNEVINKIDVDIISDKASRDWFIERVSILEARKQALLDARG